MLDKDTIVAISTAPGYGGIGIVRLSGVNAKKIAEDITGKRLATQQAITTGLYDKKSALIDAGLCIYFKAPKSFTGEDVAELHAHGNPFVLDALLRECVAYGARLARPGEFSERAFLNNKIDLAQAEAIADLISASSYSAAISAVNSLRGRFSEEINSFLDKLISLRAYIEAALDFPEDEIDFMSSGNISDRLIGLRSKIFEIMESARQGVLITEGMTVVIAGKPNAGKSSLLNALSARDSAIVTPIPGTTRDILREHIHIDGMPLHIVDTAGLRDTEDLIEQEGVRRARNELEIADRILLVVDIIDPQSKEDILNTLRIPKHIPVTVIRNKCDLAKVPAFISDDAITLSAKTGEGIDLLRKHLTASVGYKEESAGKISARRRHIHALQKALFHIEQSFTLLQEKNSPELVAEELRIAQQHLEEITGRFIPDDLLDKIFSQFCIGK